MQLVENENEKKVILLLKQKDGLLVSKISQKIKYDTGNTAKIISKLEKEGIVTKEDYAGKDMRSKKVFLNTDMIKVEIPFKNFVVNLILIGIVLAWAVGLSILVKGIQIIIGTLGLAVVIIIKEALDMHSKKGLAFVMKETKN